MLSGLNLRFSFDVIKEAFRESLVQYLARSGNTEPLRAALKALTTADFKLIFNAQDLFQRMILIAEQAKREKSHKQDSLSEHSSQEDVSSLALSERTGHSISRINDKSNLRPMIIDGNNVGKSIDKMSKQVFSFCRMRKAAEFFEKRNHVVFVILAQWRKDALAHAYMDLHQQAYSSSSPILLNQAHQQAHVEYEALNELEEKEIINYTPAKRVGKTKMKMEEDAVIMQFAVLKKAIIVSNDDYKRFLSHSDEYEHVVENHMLGYSFVNDTFVPSEDPLGIECKSFLDFGVFINYFFPSLNRQE
jgi:hypothetical protein